MSPCIGACCECFTVSSTLCELRVFIDRDHDPEAARIFAVLRPAGLDQNGRERFRCAVWDPDTRRCQQYADRPRMCANYPSNYRCNDCGAQSDADARGVALMVVQR